MTRTLAQLSQEALDIQNACNMGGLSNGFARAVEDLSPHCPEGTSQRNRHPVTSLWIAKLADLAGIDYTYPRDADAQCRKWAADVLRVPEEG